MIRAWYHLLAAMWHASNADSFTAAAATFRSEGEHRMALVALHEAGRRIMRADAHLEKAGVRRGW